jgi:hypothetical protein
MKPIALSLLLIGAVAVLAPAAAQNGTPMYRPMAPPAAGGMPTPSLAPDKREFVQLPTPMQEHMLGNMRDHLETLNGIIGDVGDGKFEDAAKLTEQRLGMSSLSFHDAAHLAPFMPRPMQDLGTSMHRAASRLSIVLQNAAVAPSVESMRDISRALSEVTAACTGCHAGYRVR